MIDDAELSAEVLRAVEPTAGELLGARQLLLAMLEESPSVVVQEFEDRWLASVGTTRPNPYFQDQRPLVGRTPTGNLKLLDPNDERLRIHKARRVTAAVMSGLLAEGLVVPSQGDNYGPPVEIISVTYSGGSDSVQIPDETPAPLSRQARVRARGGDLVFDALLKTDDYIAGLEELLGDRGLRTVREARSAMSRGLFLAGSSLLAAASEAAWFRVGSAIPNPPPKLKQCLESGRDPSHVIEASIKFAQDHKLKTPTQLAEIQAQAHNLRDIRNYALHPVEDLDADREAWLTEAGCATLMLSTRRYFVRLAELHEALLNSRISE
jgi:hypothetical protein